MVKWLLIALGAAATLAVAALISLPWLIETPVVQSQVAHAVSQALGRPVKFASLSVSALPVPLVALKDLRVAEDPAFGTGPFMTVGEGRLRIRLRPLLSGRIELADLTLRGARIAVIRDAAGRWNVATLGVPAAASPAPTRPAPPRPSGAAASTVLLSKVRVVDGALDYRQPGGSAWSLRQMDVTVEQSAPAQPLRLSGDALVETGAIRLRTRNATLALGSTRVLGDVAIRATVEVEAADVGALAAVLAPGSTMSGPLKGTIEIDGTPGRLAATGLIGLDKLTLAASRPQCGREPRRLEVDGVRLPIAATAIRVDSAPAEARVARGTVAARASVALGGDPTVTLSEISVKGMQLGPVLVDYLCQPYAVTGALDLTGEVRVRRPGGANAMSGVDGSGRLQVGPGKVVGRDIVNLLRDVVGLSTAVSAVVRPGRTPASPLDFDSITATYTIANGVVRTDDLVYRAREVRMTGAGTYTLGDGRVAMEIVLSEGANEVKGIVTGAPGSLRVVPTGVRVQDRDIKKFLDRIFR